jgi:hypothetical protein
LFVIADYDFSADLIKRKKHPQRSVKADPDTSYQAKEASAAQRES